LLIYAASTPVRLQQHGNMSVAPKASFGFAAEVNSVPIVAAEFSAAAADLTVVFAGTDKAVMPVVLLGLENNQNRFVGADGNWTGRYVPAFLRRYPFVFAATEGSGDLTLCIDEAYAGLNDKAEGERLFDSAGNRTPYLNGVLEFAVQYQTQYERTRIFCERLIANDLLESVVASFTDGDGNGKRLAGFFRINRNKLKAIQPDLLATLFATDELELCFVHLASLANIDRLAQTVRQTVAQTVAQTVEQPIAAPATRKKKVQ
jgi:hypothetical protein